MGRLLRRGGGLGAVGSGAIVWIVEDGGVVVECGSVCESIGGTEGSGLVGKSRPMSYWGEVVWVLSQKNGVWVWSWKLLFGNGKIFSKKMTSLETITCLL